MNLTSLHINGCDGARGAQSEDSYPAGEQQSPGASAAVTNGIHIV